MQGDGGVLSMDKGTALFDAVAISGTEAKARAGLVRRCAVNRALSRSGAREYSFRIVGDGATPSGRGVLHSGARAACAAR